MNEVIPHYLDVVDTTIGRTGSLGVFNNVALRVGEVVGVIYPDQPNSISKRFLEYTVIIQQRDGSDPGAPTTYPNVLVSNLFGGVADKLDYTLRVQTKSDKNSGYGDGSKVLVLCINGESNSACIIGGIKDAVATRKAGIVAEKTDGHNLNFAFNGIEALIDGDGQLILTMQGATDPDNKPRSDVDTEAVGASITMSNDGSVTIANSSENFQIDRPNHQIHLNAESNITLDSGGVLIGDATDAMILGTTYRRAEDELFNNMANSLFAMGTNLTTAAAPLVALFPSTTSNLLLVAQQMFSLQVAIQKFVGTGSQYISDRHKLDK